MIQDITLPAVFDVSVTGETSQRLASTAMTVIQR